MGSLSTEFDLLAQDREPERGSKCVEPERYFVANAFSVLPGVGSKPGGRGFSRGLES